MPQTDIEKLQVSISEGLLSLVEPMGQLRDAIIEAAHTIATSYLEAFGIIMPPIQTIVKAYWELRLPNESITDYLQRNPHKIDNPDIRWEYQVHILSAPIRWLKTIFKRDS